jgi:hypothetical protein
MWTFANSVEAVIVIAAMRSSDIDGLNRRSDRAASRLR